MSFSALHSRCLSAVARAAPRAVFLLAIELTMSDHARTRMHHAAAVGRAAIVRLVARLAV